MIEINPLPEDVQDTQLEESICQALFHTGTLVSPGDLKACHRMRQNRSDDHQVLKQKEKK